MRIRPVLFLAVLFVQSAQAKTVQVRGNSQFQAETARTDSTWQLSGILVDDNGSPLRGKPLTTSVRLLPESIEGRTTGCDPSPTPPVTTDADGRFCFRFSLDGHESANVTVDYAGDKFVSSTRFETQIQNAKRPLSLQASGISSELSFDDTLSFELFSSTEENAIKTPVANVEGFIENDERKKIGSFKTDDSGRASIVLAVHEIGLPGMHDVRVHAIPRPEFQKSTVTSRVFVYQVVVLTPSATHVQMEIGNPFHFRVAVESKSPYFPSGFVTLEDDGVVLGQGRIGQNGIATIDGLTSLPLNAERDGSIAIVPDTPGAARAKPTSVHLTCIRPFPWTTIGMAGAIVALFVLTLRGKRPAAKSIPKESPQQVPVRVGATSIATTVAQSPIHVIVRDAHELGPIADIKVTIAQEDGTGIESRVSDSNGNAVFDAFPSDSGRRIHAEGFFYSPWEGTLPRGHAIQIHLATRRRTILERFANFAMMTLGRRDVTPAAFSRDFEAVEPAAIYARAVERAVFGPDPVSPAKQSEVDELRRNAATDSQKD